ncbi:MAG: LysR family transcriptional regulator [Coriobacteriia bacterium]|nr:LysR family transcriptional regulator [Coriobacteriia bacterium]
MNFAQIQYFLAVAREGKFSTAAENSYVSQSSLSKQIKSLEEELGVELFVRSPKGTTLTPAGEVFLEFATKTYRRYEEILTRLEQYSASALLHIRVGALPLVADYGLHADIADFQIDNMGIQIDFVERNQGEILRRMELGRLDLAILRTDLLSAAEYEWIDLARDEICIVCSVRHRFAHRATVTIEQLRDERFVLLDKESAVTLRFIERCRQAGFSPNIIFTHTRHEPLIGGVGRNAGITALPRGMTRRISRDPGEAMVACIPLENPLYTNVGFVKRRNHALSAWAEKLYKHFGYAYPEPISPEDIRGASNRYDPLAPAREQIPCSTRDIGTHQAEVRH